MHGRSTLGIIAKGLKTLHKLQCSPFSPIGTITYGVKAKPSPSGEQGEGSFHSLYTPS